MLRNTFVFVSIIKIHNVKNNKILAKHNTLLTLLNIYPKNAIFRQNKPITTFFLSSGQPSTALYILLYARE